MKRTLVGEVSTMCYKPKGVGFSGKKNFYSVPYLNRKKKKEEKKKKRRSKGGKKGRGTIPETRWVVRKKRGGNQ